MKAVLIDVENYGARDVEYSGDYQEIYKLIGCQTFTVVQLHNGDSLFLDDEGLWNQDRGFWIDGFEQPFMGSGLILGCDSEGESIAPKSKASDFEGKISFAMRR